MQETICPLCPERFELRHEGKADFPEDWYLYVSHDHNQEPPKWICSVFRRQNRQRYPEGAKEVMQNYSQNRKDAVAKARNDNLSKSTNRVV